MAEANLVVKVHVISLQIEVTPLGVQVLVDGDITADNDAANVARILCRFAEGLFVSGVNVQLHPDIVEAVL